MSFHFLTISCFVFICQTEFLKNTSVSSCNVTKFRKTSNWYKYFCINMQFVPNTAFFVNLLPCGDILH